MSSLSDFKRLNFFTGFFTTEEDWNEGERYHLEKRKLHNRGLHTPGIIEGLNVEPLADGGLCVRVTAGAALDGDGNLIYLPRATTVCVPESIELPALVYITIEFNEKESNRVDNVQDPDFSGYTRITEEAKTSASTDAPDNIRLELAQVYVTSRDATIENPDNGQDPTENQINRQARTDAGSVASAQVRLDPEEQKTVSALMRDTREHFAELALRFPVPSLTDVRNGALQLQMLISSLEPEHLPGMLSVIAAVELDVEHELANQYPPLVSKEEFKAYQYAIAHLLSALRETVDRDILLNRQRDVVTAAQELSQVVFPPPVADAGPDQRVETTGEYATVALDASGSTAGTGQNIVEYIWEKES